MSYFNIFPLLSLTVVATGESSAAKDLRSRAAIGFDELDENPPSVPLHACNCGRKFNLASYQRLVKRIHAIVFFF